MTCSAVSFMSTTELHERLCAPFTRTTKSPWSATSPTTLVSGRDRAGLPIDGFDAQIASICSVHQAALATRNAKDFQDTGIEIIDPWQPESHASPTPDL